MTALLALENLLDRAPSEWVFLPIPTAKDFVALRFPGAQHPFEFKASTSFEDGFDTDYAHFEITIYPDSKLSPIVKLVRMDILTVGEFISLANRLANLGYWLEKIAETINLTHS